MNIYMKNRAHLQQLPRKALGNVSFSFIFDTTDFLDFTETKLDILKLRGHEILPQTPTRKKNGVVF